MCPRFLFGGALSFSLLCVGMAQDRLPLMPRYDRLTKARAEMGFVRPKTITFSHWTPDGSGIVFTSPDGKQSRFDMATGVLTPDDSKPPSMPASRRPERGRQLGSEISPDGSMKAVYQDNNVWVGENKEGGRLTQITRDGDPVKRIKYGSASWVYGEELSQTTAMWWSPDGKRLAFYRFDESKVPDYFVTNRNRALANQVMIEPWPKAGDPNPTVDLCVWTAATGRFVKLDAHFASPIDPDIGHYLFSVDWTPDSRELLFYRMNRVQNAWELCGGDPDNGVCRTVLSEKNPSGWIEPLRGGLPSRGERYWLQGGEGKTKQFLMLSDRDGYSNVYRFDLTGKLLAQVTKGKFDVAAVVAVDEKAGEVWYAAHDGDRYTAIQLHRVKLDGRGDVRLTDPSLNHRVSVSTAFNGFLDVAEAFDKPPFATARNRSGAVLKRLSEPDLSTFKARRMQLAERFTFQAADGSECAAFLEKPSDFDPTGSYPVIVDQYGGPGAGTSEERFIVPSPDTELGFLVLHVDGRGSTGRGRAYEQKVFHALGTVEVDDTAQAVKVLCERPYVDAKAVGIRGVSYGGYFSLMSLLRYPDVYRAASSGSPVTDWRNYDSTYTERYMGLPDVNADAYDRASVMTYADKLQGALLLYFGTADDNVHESNALQFIQKLLNLRKSYELAVGPDWGHSGVTEDRELEFFVDWLILRKGPIRSSQGH